MPYRSTADYLVLSATSAKTETSTGTDPVFNAGGYATMLFELDVTAAATAVADTLDVFVQTMVGGNWVDIVHFSQVVGDGGAKRYFAKVCASEPQAVFENASALAAAAIRHLLGDRYRARWVIVDDATDDASFTFSVKATGVGA